MLDVGAQEVSNPFNSKAVVVRVKGITVTRSFSWRSDSEESKENVVLEIYFLGQNQLIRLQMVQFECPKYRNPCFLFNFE